MRHPSPRPRRVLGALLATVALGTTAACRGDDSATPQTSASASTSTSASGSASASSTDASSTTSDSASDSTSAATGGVDPAAGPVVQLTALSMHYPEGWQEQSSSEGSASGFDPSGEGEGEVLVYDNVAFSTDTLDSDARYQIKAAKDQGLTVTRQADRTVNGVTGYVLTGSNARFKTFYEFGTVTQGRSVQITVQFLKDRADPQSVIDSVLASVTWS